MEKKIMIAAGVLLVGLIALVLVFTRLSPANLPQGDGSQVMETETPAEGRASTDPQRLMIPRWFLTSLTVDGQSVAVPEGTLSLQFEEGGSANGTASCNNFFSEYQTGEDGAMQFGPIGATKKFCDGQMEAETAYFDALSKVTRFKTEDWKLFLSSEDGKTALVFAMPPK